LFLDFKKEGAPTGSTLGVLDDSPERMPQNLNKIKNLIYITNPAI
jgi:hypothetical protein